MKVFDVAYCADSLLLLCVYFPMLGKSDWSFFLTWFPFSLLILVYLKFSHVSVQEKKDTVPGNLI